MNSEFISWTVIILFLIYIISDIVRINFAHDTTELSKVNRMYFVYVLIILQFVSLIYVVMNFSLVQVISWLNHSFIFIIYLSLFKLFYHLKLRKIDDNSSGLNLEIIKTYSIILIISIASLVLSLFTFWNYF